MGRRNVLRGLHDWVHVMFSFAITTPHLKTFASYAGLPPVHRLWAACPDLVGLIAHWRTRVRRRAWSHQTSRIARSPESQRLDDCLGPLLSRGGRCDGTVRACFGHLLLNSNCALQSSTVDQGRLCEVVSARTAGYGGVFLYRRFHFVSRYRERKTVVSGFRGLSTPCQRQACCSFPNADNSCVTGHAGSLSERELDHLYGLRVIRPSSDG